jgi:hypothetical protein
MYRRVDSGYRLTGKIAQESLVFRPSEFTDPVVLSTRCWGAVPRSISLLGTLRELDFQNSHGRDLGHRDHGGEEAHKRGNIDVDHAGPTAVNQTVGTRAAHKPLFPVSFLTVAHPNSQQNRLPCGHQRRRQPEYRIETEVPLPLISLNPNTLSPQ